MTNQGSVTIQAHPQTGLVVNAGKTPGYSSIRVDQEVTTMENGFLSVAKRVAFINGKTEHLNAMNFKEGQTLPGKIVVRETLDQPDERVEPKINPESGEVLTSDGKPIYRQSFYTDDLSATDKLIQHDNITKRSSEAVTESEVGEEAPAFE